MIYDRNLPNAQTTTVRKHKQSTEIIEIHKKSNECPLRSKQMIAESNEYTETISSEWSIHHLTHVNPFACSDIRH